MKTKLYLKNRIKRQIGWNGQELKFIRFKRDEYHQLTDEIEKIFIFNGIFHEGGGYGGMLNIEMYERDGGRTTSIMKPMVLCLYEDGINLDVDDTVIIGDYKYRIVEKSDFKNMQVAFDVSLEIANER